MMRGPILTLAALALLSGCAGREAPSSPTFTADASAPEALSFSEQVAHLPQGVRDVADSPFGPAAIDAGPAYHSGLGEECRSARATRDGETILFAVCRGPNGAWRFIPTIFESMPR